MQVTFDVKRLSTDMKRPTEAAEVYPLAVDYQP